MGVGGSEDLIRWLSSLLQAGETVRVVSQNARLASVSYDDRTRRQVSLECRVDKRPGDVLSER